MRGRSVVAIGSASLMLSGCFGGQPVRLRYAEGSQPLEQPVEPILSITSIEASTPGATRIQDLSEAAAAAYITALASKIPEPDAFRAAVAGGIAPGQIGDADQTKLARTVAIGIGRNGYNAGQRLVSASVVIVPIGFEFADLTMVSSKYAFYDLETVSVQSTTTGKISISPKLGNVIEGGEASLTREDTAGTTYSNRARVESLTPEFRPDRITIRQESGPNEDLTGLVLANISVRPITFDEDAKRKLRTEISIADQSDLKVNIDQTRLETVVAELKIADGGGRTLDASQASITTVVNEVWMPRALKVCAAMTYVERTPRKGSGRYYDEGRQDVEEREGNIKGRIFTLVPQQDVARSLWGIAHQVGFLMIDTPTGPNSFSFHNPLEASRFAAWLSQTRATRVGEKRLWTSGAGPVKPLRLGVGEAVRVQRVEWDRSDASAASTRCTVLPIGVAAR